ncbi:MAG: Adaptive-response sensory-kinase SasA [Elusimicrobia bacterium]|nr:Adaptive-response sensory-kinase SasA [Elusimicrobiota bacterium]
MPLKLKLAFFSTLLVVFVAVSLSTFIRQGQKKAIVETQKTARLDTVKALRQVAREAILVDDDTGLVNYVNLLQKSLTTAHAMVIDEQGRIRVHTDPTLIGTKVDDPASLKALESRDRQDVVVQNLTSPDGKNILDYSIPILLGQNPAEYRGVARIGFDKNVIDEEIQESLRIMDQRIKGAFFLALILGIVGAFLLATFITKPIETLRTGAQQIGEGKLSHRIEVHTNDELRELADDFNAMAKKLGELDEMKQDFVSNVTHELRSPMTSIRGYVDLLLQGAPSSLSQTQKDYLSVIKNSAVRLGRFIDNLLDVAKIEANKLNLTPESLSLHELGYEMTVLFKPQLDEKGIVLKNLIPKEMPPAFVDKDKLAEVFINLTSNAIKFTPEKGTIEFQAAEGEKHLEVRVQDNGPGIPEDKAAKLFNKFEQVKSNQGLARKHKGTGLGLTIAKGIIEAHGGKIWIKSPGPHGVGTAFYFSVPKLTAELKERLANDI